MMVIIMRADVLETIRDTFEETKHINIQYLLVQQEGDGEVVYGLFTNHVADSISFLYSPENTIETEIDNIKIFMLELGTVLRYIYYHGALNFLHFFHHDSTLMIPSDNFLKLSEYVMKNIPLNIGKAYLISKINDILDKKIIPNDEEMKNQVILVFDYLLAYSFYDKQFCLPTFDDDYMNMFDDWNDKNIVLATNYLQDVIHNLEDVEHKKISENAINEIDRLYIRIQIDSDKV